MTSKNVATIADEKSAVSVMESFPVMQIDPKEVSTILAENVGPSGMTEFDLDRFKVPSGGGTHWAIPQLDGSTDMQPDIQGVIIHWKDIRSYWATSFGESGGGSPPDCQSQDCAVGHGEPGGDCRECPLAKFGSADQGRGQACKQIRVLFLLTQAGILPNVIQCPPTSVGVVKKYMLRLANFSIPFQSVLTGFKLVEDKNNDGIKYARIEPRMVARLDENDLKAVRSYAESIMPLLRTMDITPDREQAETE